MEVFTEIFVLSVESFDANYIASSVNLPICDNLNCGGLIKPDVVLYEEGLSQETIVASIEAITNADVLIIGTSLIVYPAASFIHYYNGNKMVYINKAGFNTSGADFFIQASIA